jgi:hypothetical protein
VEIRRFVNREPTCIHYLQVLDHHGKLDSTGLLFEFGSDFPATTMILPGAVL